MVFKSSLPWLHCTALIQSMADGDESIPRISWGKYGEVNGKTTMPVSILAHHALVDGVHIARFYDNLNREIENINRQ